MPSLPPPAEEAERLARLRALAILDSEPEPLFDQLARTASEACGVPIALIGLMDEQRLWFKAQVGLPATRETQRNVAFCAHTLAQAAPVFEVRDALVDARFADNPLVTGAPQIRFYAGAPLVLPDGVRVGTLCVMDRQARQLTASQTELLRSLAAITSQALLMRQRLIDSSLSVRSHYERALADSESRYRAIVEDQTELVSLAHADGELVYVNPAYARHFGLAPADMVGMNLFDFIEPADHEAVRRQIDSAMLGGTSLSDENRMVAHDGSERWVAWTNRLQHDASGLALLHSVGRDITERKRAEQALRASQAFLDRTERVAGVGGWEIDLATNALTWSDETRRIHEVGADFVLTLDSSIAFYPPSARPLIEAALKRGMESGEPWDIELPRLTATGRQIWVRSQGEVELEDGKPRRLVGAFHDITDRKLLEQRLADNESFLRQITDGLPLRIAYLDKERRYRFVNLAQCERLGHAREAIIGRTRGELIVDANDAELQERFSAALRGQPQRFELDETVGNEVRRIEFRLNADVSPAGEIRGVFSTSIDITERSAAEKALRELTTIFDNTTDFVIQTDSHGAVGYINPAARRATGLAPDESMAYHRFSEFITPATQRSLTEQVLPGANAHGVWVGEATVYMSGRRELPVSLMVIAHRAPDGHIERYSALMRDISGEVRAKQQLLQQTATLRSVTETIPAIVGVVGVDQRYRFVNTAFERWIGAPRERIIGRTLAEVLGAFDYERSRVWIDRALAGETVQFERNYVGAAGVRHLSLAYIPLRLEDGQMDGFVGVAQDITQHRQEESRLLQLSQRDPLTNLLNRAGFEDELERGVQAGNGASLALLYVDLDHFKPVNDKHGHPVGDKVLKLFAQRLRALVRPSDAVARLGGDEFAVLLVGVRESTHAQAVAAKVIAAARAPFEVAGLQLRIGASVGVAFGIDAATGWHGLIARADAMLYQAKAEGRGRQAGAAG